ncbi:MAG: class I SAM-dependent methyltransferase [Steroidobacteraceae bacterium]
MFCRERWSEQLASETGEYFDRWAREGLPCVWGSRNYDADAARWYRAPDIMAEHLKPWLSAGAQILDVGCGTGLSGQNLIHAGHQVSGIDLSSAMAEKARLRGYREVLVGDATVIEWIAAFECVLCVGLIGDWMPAAKLLPGLSKALLPGGVLALTVPQWSGQARKTRKWLGGNRFQIKEHHRALGFRKPLQHRKRYDFLIAQIE